MGSIFLVKPSFTVKKYHHKHDREKDGKYKQKGIKSVEGTVRKIPLKLKTHKERRERLGQRYYLKRF